MLNPDLLGNLFNKPNLNIYLGDTIEVGYDLLGATLAISGNFTTTSKIIFIEDLILNIQHEKSDRGHALAWNLLRPHLHGSAKYQSMDYKPANKFFLTPNESFQYNIVFNDTELQQVLSPIFRDIKNLWTERMEKNYSAPSPLSPQALFENFLKEKVIDVVREELEGLCFWSTGTYALTLQARTRKGDLNFETRKIFSLSPQDTQALAKNAALIIAELCNQPKVPKAQVTTKLV